ncbi:site-specific recombinase XerD [Geomicrobium halophilum]|uniref:Site-specific recombinase XerD n=1 Tax=Geomicrobium halophilum TaxID=549000 RepID=A0A841PK35_9BACL|nr:tyrosine-type recombinase/integrase [Geomicrobium halophilum]MBB6449227.1 site-specific recombinase XerD [Geomicrobium halophilum]
MHPQGEKLPKEAQHFLDFLASRGRKPSTLRRYAYDLADFYSFAFIHGDQKTASNDLLDPSLLEDYFAFMIERRKYNHKTTKRIAAVLKRYFYFLSQTYGLGSNPMESVTLPPADDEKITQDHLLSAGEIRQLLTSIESDLGLSEEQAQARPLLAPRNKVMIQLLLHQGLRLQELHGLSLDDVNFGTGTMTVSPEDGEVKKREIQLSKNDRRDLHRYVQMIPKPVRPYPGEGHPLFVSFDFQKQTYRWSYEDDEPKRLTIVAMQKMIREESKRAGLAPGKSAQHFRHTYIVSALKHGHTLEELQEKLGLHSELVLLRYQEYVNHIRSK